MSLPTLIIWNGHGNGLAWVGWGLHQSLITSPVCNTCPYKPVFICSKSAEESPEKGVKSVQS